MKHIFLPPNEHDHRRLPQQVPRLFLAGTIEMGTAVDWQTAMINDPMFDAFHEVCIFNPRRQNWDPSWVQSIENVKFKQQVDWELDRITESDLVVFNFEAESKSPITLMELGLAAGMRKCSLVCCPDGFWRKGNVEIITDRFGIRLVNNRERFIYETGRMLRKIVETKTTT